MSKEFLGKSCRANGESAKPDDGEDVGRPLMRRGVVFEGQIMNVFMNVCIHMYVYAD